GITRRERALFVQVTHRHFDQLQFETRLGGDDIALVQELVGEAAADDAATQDSDTYAHGGKTVVLRHSAPEPPAGRLGARSTRSRSSGDRALVSGTRCAGSSPAGSAVLISRASLGGRPPYPRTSAYWCPTPVAPFRAPGP